MTMASNYFALGASRSEPVHLRRGCAVSCASFGELLQGTLPGDEQDFLVTLPIHRYALATFVSDPTLSKVRVMPAHKWKSGGLASRLLEMHGLPPGGRLRIVSEIPEGKGIASSTADLVATTRAMANCFGLRLPVAKIEALLREVEPSDGIMYGGITAYHHRRVQLLRHLGFLPPLAIVALDEGGEVDTLEFNDRVKSVPEGLKAEYGELLNRLAKAVERSDLATVGRVATRSAELAQAVYPKRTFDDFKDICERFGAIGMVVAHSGTCLGALLPVGLPERLRAVCQAVSRLDGRVEIHWTIGGSR